MVCTLEEWSYSIYLIFNLIAAHRQWRNQLTGNWGFSDPYDMMQLKFERKEDAIRFCQTQGFNYEVEELPPQFPPVFKQYADKIQPPAVLSKMRAVSGYDRWIDDLAWT